MVWNVHKSGVEKKSPWTVCMPACLRTCVKISKNSNVCISRSTQPIELKFGMEVKPKCLFVRYNFCRN